MACDTQLKPRQTIQERAKEVREATVRLAEALAAGRVKPVIGKDGAVAFTGWEDASRDGVTDACAYRRIMATGTQLAKLALQKAEMLAGRKINPQTVAQGLHSHDGGASWHKH